MHSGLALKWSRPRWKGLKSQPAPGSHRTAPQRSALSQRSALKLLIYLLDGKSLICFEPEQKESTKLSMLFSCCQIFGRQTTTARAKRQPKEANLNKTQTNKIIRHMRCQMITQDLAPKRPANPMCNVFPFALRGSVCFCNIKNQTITSFYCAKRESPKLTLFQSQKRSQSLNGIEGSYRFCCLEGYKAWLDSRRYFPRFSILRSPVISEWGSNWVLI